jgi:hypothetical protein
MQTPKLVSETSENTSVYPASTKITKTYDDGSVGIHYAHFETPQINDDGKAFTGRWKPVALAIGLVGIGILAAFGAGIAALIG